MRVQKRDESAKYVTSTCQSGLTTLTGQQAELGVQRAKEAEARLEAEERARIAKLPRHQDLELSVLLGEEGLPEIDKLTAAFSSLTHKSSPRRTGDPEVYVFQDDKSDKAAVEELRVRLKSMKVFSRAKVTQDRVYSCAYHPEPTKDLIFFGGELSWCVCFYLD
jgi:hypothetical protein